MFRLDHKEYKNFDPKHRYFLTVTLPKIHYSKSVSNQKPAMNRRLMKVLTSVGIIYAQGCYEVTMGGNLHCHFLTDFHLDDDEETNLIMARTLFKQFGIIDVQKIKHRDKVEEYILKDVIKTAKIFKINGAFTWSEISPYVTYIRNLQPLENLIIEYKSLHILDNIMDEYTK